MDLYLCNGKEILRQEIQTRGAAIQIPVKEGKEVSYLQVMREGTSATRKTGFSSSQTQIDIFFFNPANFGAAAELRLPLQGRFSIACFRQTSKPSGSGAAEAYALREKGSGTAPGSAVPPPAPCPHLRRRPAPGPLRSAPLRSTRASPARLPRLRPRRRALAPKAPSGLSAPVACRRGPAHRVGSAARLKRRGSVSGGSRRRRGARRG